MNKFLIAVLFLSLSCAAWSQGPSIPSGRGFFHQKIDDSQKELLKLNGVRGAVQTAATTQIDDLQTDIEADSQLNNNDKIKFLRGFEEALERLINGCRSNRYNINILPGLVSNFKAGIPLEAAGKSIEGVVAANGYDAGFLFINNFAYEKNVGYNQSLRILTSLDIKAHPERIIPALIRDPDLPGSDSFIIVIAHKDPETIYTLAQAHDALAAKIRSVQEKLVSIISRMAQMKTGRQFFPFLDELYADKMTFEQIDSAINDQPKYYRLLVQTEIDYADRVRQQDIPLAKADMEIRLAAKAHELYVNEINALHEKPDNVRFKVIDKLSPQELYYLAVSSEEEIYTSSYVRGVYPRIWNKLKRSDSLLVSVRFDHFKKWIKMAANYNTLDDFLKRMDKESGQVLMKAFVKGLDRTSSLEDAVDVANSYASIGDKTIRRLVLNEVQYSLQKAKNDNNTRGTNIYKILNILFLSMDSANHVDVSKLLGIPPVYFMPNKNLQDTAGKIIVQQFFYGDDDGRAGFAQFTSLLSNGNWKMTGNDQWVTHTSTGKGVKVVIYSNRPLDEKKGLDGEAQKALDEYLDKNDLHPTIIIHRGHSYYLKTTLDQLQSSAQVVVLGSCGAYQSLNQVLTLCPTAHIVSSKQTGSQRINGPLISVILNTIRQGKDLDWPAIWKTLGGMQLDTELFNDYVPPYKNLGALFIMAYNKTAN